jgi:inosose dehydratase
MRASPTIARACVSARCSDRPMRIANAPCSWGVLEFDPGDKLVSPGPDQVLDEIAQTGYAGTELGDWGFFSTDPARLREDLARRSLSLVGAFVPVALSNPAAHAEGEALAVRTARLIAAVGDRPHVILSDATAAVPARTAKAGRITPEDGLSTREWEIVADGAHRIASAVRDATGLRTAFHHHCATYVETAGEIDTLMQMTAPDLVGLCLDTGHATFGGADPLALLRTFRDRIQHVHFKDCSPTIADASRREGWSYVTAVRRGIFCELGAGSVNFAAILDELQRTNYDGWIVVEQDVLPSMGTPAESAARNRAFLRRLGS